MQGSATSSGLLSHMIPPWNADVALEYQEKVADLVLEFAGSDTTVKSYMCSQSLLSRLFQMFNKIDPAILLKEARTSSREWDHPASNMAHASRNSREQLRAHEGLDVYLTLLDDEYWSVTALDSIAVCLAHDNDDKKVELSLLKKRGYFETGRV
ncbi:hypothetical protein AgCh_009357 [Apium graveolens]